MELEDCAFRCSRGSWPPATSRRRSTARPGRCSSARSPARPAWSAATCSGQRRDLQAAGPGDQRPRRRRRPRAGRGQPVQHELSHRPLERARSARRPMVRDDPAGREPGQAQLAKKAGVPVRRSRTSRSGETTPPRSSPTRERPDRRQARPPTSSPTRVAARRVHRDGAEAGRGGHRGARGVLGRLGGERRDRLGAERPEPHGRGDWHSVTPHDFAFRYPWLKGDRGDPRRARRALGRGVLRREVA